MLLRILLLPLLAAATACGGSDRPEPAQERTYYCGSYESASPGTVTSEPPC